MAQKKLSPKITFKYVKFICFFVSAFPLKKKKRLHDAVNLGLFSVIIAIIKGHFITNAHSFGRKYHDFEIK